MATTTTKIAIVSTQRACTRGMRKLFGHRPLVLRRKPLGEGGWWGTILSSNVALFDTEGEARAWLVRTFEHPLDRTHLHTMAVPVVRAMDAKARGA